MSHVQVEPKALKTVGCVGVFLVTDARSATVDLLIGSGSIRGAFPLPALAPQGRPGNWTSCSGASKLAPIPPTTWPSITIGRPRQGRRPKHSPQIGRSQLSEAEPQSDRGSDVVVLEKAGG